jgi:hypothetical protein
MEKKIYVVEKECGYCGAPIGENVISIREAREGDIFGHRQVTESEVPDRWSAAVASAHAEIAIKVYANCGGCED